MEDLTQVKINELWTIFRRQLSELLTNTQLDPHSRDPIGGGGSVGISANSWSSADARPTEQVQREKNKFSALANPQVFCKPSGDTSEQENDVEAAAVVIVSPAGCKAATSPVRFGETVPVVHSRLSTSLFLHHSRPSCVAQLPPKQTLRDCGNVYMSPPVEEEPSVGRWSRMCSRYLRSAKERSRRKSHTSSPAMSGEGSEGEEPSSSRRPIRAKGCYLGGLGMDSSESDGEGLPTAEQYCSTPSPAMLDSDSDECRAVEPSHHHGNTITPAESTTSKRRHNFHKGRTYMSVGRSVHSRDHVRKVSPSPREEQTSLGQLPIKSCTVVVQRESGRTVAEQLKRLQEAKGSPMREPRSPCTPLSSVSSTPSKVSLSVLAGDMGKVSERVPPHRREQSGLSDSSADTRCDGMESDVANPTSSSTAAVGTMVTTPKVDHGSTQAGTSGRKKGLSLNRDTARKRVMVKEMPSGSQQVSYTQTSLPEMIVCTACGTDIDWKHSPIHEHQRLHVLVCQSCWASFNSGSFVVGEDNTENYCTLCGEGGDLVCCDSCIKSFCQACIRRTSGEPFLQTLLQDGSTWNCYCCDSRPMTTQQQLCKDLCDYYRIRKCRQRNEKTAASCDGSGNETDPTIASSTLDRGVNVKLEMGGSGTPPGGKGSGDKDRRGKKKFKTPAVIDTDSSEDGNSVEVHSDEVVVSDVEDMSLKKKAARRAVVGSSSGSGHEGKAEKKGSDDGGSKRPKKRRLGMRRRLGSDGVLSTSDSSSNEATDARPSRLKKRSWSSSTSESTRKNKKLRHSELAAAVSSDSDCDDDDGKKCDVKLGDAGNDLELTGVLEGGDDSLDRITPVTYAPFRTLDTSNSDEEVSGQQHKGAAATAESTTDSEDATGVGGKPTRVLQSSDSDILVREHCSRGPANKKKKRVLRYPLSSDEDSLEDPEDKAQGTKEGEEKGDQKEGEEKGEEEDSQEKVPGKKRRKIREIIADSKLTVSTKEAQKLEKERIERLKARANKQDGTLVEQRLILEEDPKTKEVKVEVRKSLVPSLLPHQREGVKFLYDSCIESLERLQSEGRTEGRGGGGGCILAHCMGLGKTLQVIAFLDALMNVKDSGIAKVLILIPVNALHNWMKEFLYWIPNADRQYEIFMVSMLDTGVRARYHKLKYWQEQGGVMLMGFEMFRNLALGTRLKQKSLQVSFKQYLLDPGPDLIVCDEGHVLRSSKSNLSTIVNQMKTLCRVVLTGTPLQNNLLEYYTMVSFVKPNLLGTLKEFTNRFVNPIMNGQCRDSTSQDVRRMKQRAHVLHDMLKASVQRRDYRVLAECLPPKQEYVLAIRLSPMQDQLYRLYLEHTRGYHTASDLFSTFATLLKIWDHPWVLKLHEDRREEKRERDNALADEDTSDSLDGFIVSGSEEEGGGGRNKKKPSGGSVATSSTGGKPSKRGVVPFDDVIVIDTDEEERPSSSKSKGGPLKDRRLKLETRGSSSSVDPLIDEAPDIVGDGGRFWFNKVLSNVENRLDFSGKLVFLLELLKETEKLGEKVLVFSQSLTLLDLIEEFLNRPEYGEWTPGLDYYRLDGATRSEMRMSFMDQFNAADSPRLRLFIISTKAGSLGVNLVAANRVVIFDACWNPSHDLQSIFRTYRFGQSKPVFVYRLLAKGTMEEKIYDRQVTKQSLSMRVVDEKQIGRHYTQSDLAELFTYSPPPPVSEAGINGSQRPEVDPVLCSLLDRLQPQWIVGYHEHDSLLQHIFDEELSEEDRKQAWDNYKAQMDAETGVYNLKALQSHLDQGPQTSQGAFAVQPIGQQTQAANNILSVLQSAISKVRTLNKLQEDKTKFSNLLPQVPEARQGPIKEELARLKHQISTEYIAVAESIKNVNRFLTSCHSGNIVLDTFLSQNINYLRSILSDELQKMKTSGGLPQQQHTNGPTYSSMQAQSKPGVKIMHQPFPRGPL